jgi:hypothetical protein
MVSNWILKLWIINALLDSTYSKDSNDILFVIFGPRNQKIWFFKDLAKIRFEFLIWTLIDLGADTWPCLIAPYRFGWGRVMRWPRERERLPRLHPDEGEGGGWRDVSGDVLRVLGDGVDLWRIGPSQLVREKHRWKIESPGGERGARAHRRWRISPEELADGRRFVEEFRWFETKSSREKKGGELGRGPRGIYSWPRLAEGARVWARGRRWTAEDDPVQEESLPEVGDDMWVLGVSR